MVKLLVLSDLHVEFGAFSVDASTLAAADVVVLAGDIHTGTQAAAWARSMFGNKPIVYVAGNHEFYGHDWVGHLAAMRKACAERDVQFLENDAVEIGGVRFLGCTLWTDFALFGAERAAWARNCARRGLNDYNRIKRKQSAEFPTGNPWRLMPEMTVQRHRASVDWLREQLGDGKSFATTVVITHHAPSPGSIAPRFVEDPLTPAYASDLTHLMGLSAVWIHGHCHDSADYVVAGTRVLCNPRGYTFRSGQIENDLFNPGLLVELATRADPGVN